MDRPKQQQEYGQKRRCFSCAFTNLSVLIILMSMAPNVWGAFRVNQFQISGACNHSFLMGENPLNSTLAAIGREMVQPGSVSKGISDSHEHYAKSLPAVPAAIFLVLTGFLCVSTVRDRKAWLAALAYILWFSQSGLPAVVKAVSTRIGSGDYLTKCSSVQREAKTGHSPVSMESSEYLGLLYYHRAGVPQNRSILKILPGYRSRKTALNTDNDKPVQQWAINFIRPYSDSAVKSENFAEKHIVLLSTVSPAIFPRGPPNIK